MQYPVTHLHEGDHSDAPHSQIVAEHLLVLGLVAAVVGLRRIVKPLAFKNLLAVVCTTWGGGLGGKQQQQVAKMLGLTRRKRWLGAWWVCQTTRRKESRCSGMCMFGGGASVQKAVCKDAMQQRQ